MSNAEQKPVADTTPETTKRKASVGEHVFDFSVYGLMNYLGTLIITVPIAHSMQYGLGKPVFDRVASHLPSQNVGGKLSHALLMATTTMQGGNVMLLPVKWAESHKVGFVNKVNKMVGDKTDSAEVQEVPKQTWGSLIRGRALAWVTVFSSMFGASFVLGKQFNDYEEWFGRKTSAFVKKAPYENLSNSLIREKGALKGAIAKAELRGENTKALEEKLADLGKKISEHESRPFHYGRIISIDIFATAAATALLFIGSRFFAKRSDKKHAKPLAAPLDTPAGAATASPSANIDAAPAPEKDNDESKPRTQVAAGEVAVQRALAQQNAPAVGAS